ncbi:MAG TPA: tetratricopeptide repeat protein, partial [Candidatus Omnitrophota bacterium]|nr:tetratricopeptide repeat protein [Candidatus Omnitrophota bacterium]
YVELAGCYRERGEYVRAEAFVQKALEIDAQNDLAYTELGWLYHELGRLEQAETFVQKAIELNPENDWAYAVWGWILYERQRPFDIIESAFRKAIALNPLNDSAYCGLGSFYSEQGDFARAEDILKQAVVLNPRNERACGALSALYAELKKPALAKQYAQKADRLRLEDSKGAFIHNYRAFKQILDKRGIPMICMQYPLRDITPLKKIFKNDKNIIFIDNRAVFEKIIASEGFKEIFRDKFAGDFGHCTEKGNRFLAEHIARVILKEIFGKKRIY